MNIDRVLDDAFSKVIGKKFVPFTKADDFDADEVSPKKDDGPVMPKATNVGSKLWKNRVRFNLVAGFGVEDIAIKLGCTADDVRQEVRLLRWNGQLAKWWKNG